jgi:hypothetical protein
MAVYRLSDGPSPSDWQCKSYSSAVYAQVPQGLDGGMGQGIKSQTSGVSELINVHHLSEA